MHQPVYPTLDPSVHPLPVGTLVQVHDATYDEDCDLETGPLERNCFWNEYGTVENWAFEGDVGTIVSVDYNDHKTWFPTYGVTFPNRCCVYYDHDDSSNHYDFHIFQEA